MSETDPDAVAAFQRLQRATSKRTIQKVNRYLLEGLFFYRRDNPELFDLLSSRRSDFAELWDAAFDLELVIDEHVAYRKFRAESPDPYAGFLNEHVPKAGRMHFNWHGQGSRERIVVFLHFLRYYEEVLRRADEGPYGERRFLWHEFVAWMQERLREAFQASPERMPTPNQLHAAIRDVFHDLERFRFIERRDSRDLREGEKERLPSAYQEDEITQFHAMPGLLAYDATTLTQSLIQQAYAMSTPAGDGADDDADEPLE